MSSLSDATVCTPDQLQNAAAERFYCLSRKENVGAVVVAVAAFISLSAIAWMFVLILRNIIRERNSKARLIERPMDLFMLSLFIADLIQALGVVLEVKWIDSGIVQVGSYCTAQGILQNIGQAAIAMNTLIITLHTFDSIWRKKGIQSLGIASLLVGILWIFLVLFCVISSSVHTSPPYYVPTPYWCWINDAYPRYRIASENFWLWLAFGVAVLYIPLIFWSQGYITPNSQDWWGFEIHRKPDTEDSESQTERGVSLYLIICALTYCIPVLPSALARWFIVVHQDAKPFGNAAAQFSVKAIFSLSGLIDVVVFLKTREGLLLFPADPVFTSTYPSAISLHSRNQENPAPAHANGNAPGTDDTRSQPPNGAPPNHDDDGHPAPRVSLRMATYLLLWLIVNGFDAAWITFYLRSVSNPNPRTPVNIVHSGWKGYYIMMYLFGLCWGCVNAFVWLLYFKYSFIWLSRRVEARHYRFLLYLVNGLIFLPVAIIMVLGPFFSPSIGVKLMQKEAWNHRCDSFPVEVVLNGLPYGAPSNQTSSATFYVRQPDGSLLSYYEYHLAGNDSIWQLQRGWVRPNVTYPSVQNITYFDNNTIIADCQTAPGATVDDSCANGSFDETGYLSFSINSTSSIAHLQAVDKEWDYSQSDDAPSFILKQVDGDGSLGDTIVRTAVTDLGQCTALKMCSMKIESNDIRALAPIGLALMKQKGYSVACTTPNSN